MRRLILIFLALISTHMVSQTITGIVKDTIGSVAFADVILKDTSNNIITGTTTNDNGKFNIKAQKGTYTIQISFLGYQNWSKKVTIDSDLNLGVINLKEDAEALEEVVVKTKKRVIQRKVDRLVFNVEKSIVAEGGNGIDILKIAPRVQVQNGTVEILGKGASRLLINGRLSPLEGDELTAFLENLNSNDIKSIEVITNPPAKYEASSSGGLINIILKKGLKNSWKNAITLTHNQNKYHFNSLRNSFTYNKNNISLAMSMNATKGFHNHIEGLVINYPENLWDINVQSKERNVNYSGRFLLDYTISDKTTIGVQYLGSKSNPGGFSTVTSTVFNTNKNVDKTIENKGDNNINTKNNAINFHAITAIDSLGKSISFDVDYFQYNSKNNRDFITENFSANNNSLGVVADVLNTSNQNIENLSAKADVELPFNKVKLLFGGKASFTTTNSEVLFFNRLSGVPILETNKSNNFKYTENNIATYVSANTNLTGKVKMKIGMRMENVTTKGTNEGMSEENENRYTKLFPTVFFKYTKNDKNSFSFSYGKRINRPRFSDLNPFRYYINDNSYSEGNPFLQPSFTDSFELSHTYKRNLTSSAFVNVTTNGFGVVFTSDTNNQTQIITRENYFTQYNYGIIESFSFNKISWWQSQNSLNLLGYYSIFDKTFKAKPKNGMQVLVTSNNTFSMSKSTKFMINSWYSSSHNRGLSSVGNMFNLSIGLQHTFKNSGFKMSFLANDIFDTSSLNNYESIVNGVKQTYRANSSTRNFRISVSYNFGNQKIKNKEREFGNNEERNRAQ
ncbi:outer membrane beta-barrel protein [Tenacibaculum sp. 190524A02b]|uniref:outer membrane beta-barrel protein n=1 Tax=Tenacibaculum vairaonense TaxID=3137860 RepID=UPI0031FB051C